MVLSPGTGGAVGGSPTPFPYELETSAAIVTARAQLGIVPPNIMIPLPEMDRQAVWKYTATSGNPLLASPQVRLRMATSSGERDDTSWQEKYTDLRKRLPTELREELEMEKRLPMDERGSFDTFDHVLVATAKALTWGSHVEEESTARPTERMSEPDVVYGFLYALCATNLNKTTEQVLIAVNQHLEAAGRANPHYEDQSEIARAVQEYFEVMDTDRYP